MAWLRAHLDGLALAVMLVVLAGSFLSAQNGGALTGGPPQLLVAL